MFVSVVSPIRPSTLHRPYRTPEDGAGKILKTVHYAGVVSLSVQGEGEQTGGFYDIYPVPVIIEGV